MEATRTSLPPNVVAALKAGNAVEAVRLLRQAKGLGLLQAVAELASKASELQRQDSSEGATATLSAATKAALARGDKVAAIRQVRQETGADVKQAKATVDAAASGLPLPRNRLSPGEVPRSNADLWLLLALAAVILVAMLAG